MEFTDNIVSYATTSEIGLPDAFPVDVVVKRVAEIFAGEFVYDEQTFTGALRLFFLIRQFPFLNFDMVFLGKPPQCFGVGELFMLHDEVYGVPSLSTSEAFA